MKRAVIKNNLILLLLAFTVFFIIVFFTLEYFERNNRNTLMSFVLNEVALEYENHIGTPEDFVDTYVSETRRITILDANGYVIADTHDDEVGTDKSMRPEIQNLGEVFIRTSDTIDIELLYIATQLDDDSFLRVSITRDSQSGAYATVIWVLILTSLGFIGIYYAGLIQINKNLLKPWDQIKKGLLQLSSGNYQLMSLSSPYEEINEMLHEINMINLETQEHLRSIESYQIQLNEILNGLKQGVMLFDEQERLVYFNEDAKKFFDLSEDALMKPSYYTIRDNEIKDAISKANERHQPVSFDIRIEGKITEVNIFYVQAQGLNHTKATVLVLIKDVSQERAMEQIKRDFFSHASHELKSPLTAIRGYAELIEHRVISEDEIEQTAKQIVKQTENMTALVEDMLMLSRLENLKEKAFVNQDLKVTLDDVIKDLTPIATKKNIALHVISQKTVFPCDPMDVQKLFKNLIENAIKYSEENKRVTIELKQDTQGIVFKVQDQGYGIAPEHQQRVFERFYRVDKGRLDGGTGLGLAIVKHIVLKYGGTIDLKSNLSKGTTIIIRL